MGPRHGARHKSHALSMCVGKFTGSRGLKFSGSVGEAVNPSRCRDVSGDCLPRPSDNQDSLPHGSQVDLPGRESHLSSPRAVT